MRRSKLAVVAALAAVSVTALPGGGTADAALGVEHVKRHLSVEAAS